MFQADLQTHGCLLHQGQVNVIHDKKNHNARFSDFKSKSKPRRLFLFEKCAVVCKTKEDSNKLRPWSFVHAIKVVIDLWVVLSFSLQPNCLYLDLYMYICKILKCSPRILVVFTLYPNCYAKGIGSQNSQDRRHCPCTDHKSTCSYMTLQHNDTLSTDDVYYL